MIPGGFFRRLSALVGLIGILSASLSGCGGGGGNSTGGDGDTGSRAACAANARRSNRTARWTVLVYINAANNLQPDSLTNIAQMASVGSDANVNIVIQWKQANCADCGVPSFTGTRRYLIKPHSAADITRIQNGDTSVLNADRLSDPTTNDSTGQSDMGDWRTLQNFVQWGASTYPADNLALVCWDHGSGWQPVNRSSGRLPAITRAFSQDNASGNEIETQELPQALANLPQPLDMLIFDCSLMQMIEVAYEARNTARVLVGSEESPPGAGYPYDTWLADLKASGANPCEVGNSLINRFVAAYPTYSNITQSMLDLSKLNATATALDNFANALRTHVADESSLLRSARQNVQSYKYPDNKDLIHYAALIQSGTTHTDLKQAATALQTALTGSGGAILNARHGSSGQDNSNGLAIYIPAPLNYLSAYNDLALSRLTHWDEFLKAQTQ